MVNTVHARLTVLLTSGRSLGLGALLMGLWLFSGTVSATVTAEADRTRLYQDEILTLTIRADFPAANDPLDLTALNTLFQVVGQSQTTQSRFSTAQGQERWREWRLQLQPREIGTLAIPNFTLGGDQSSPIMITVMDPADRQEGLPEQAVILTVSIDDDQLYVGQSTRLTINLDYQIRLQGNFNQLDLSAFNAQKLTEDNTRTRHVGELYQRYQLVYRLTPEQAGTLSIPEIRFVGQYESSNYGQTMRMNRIHPGLAVEARPIPASYPADAAWLPAESVTLSDNLTSTVQAEVNEHLDWQITTRIQGQPATQLPDPLKAVSSSDFRLYRNSPEFSDAVGPQQRVDQVALVFAAPGTYDLPAVRVPWWDTTTDSLRYAELPARAVRIEGISNEAMDILTDPSRLNARDPGNAADLPLTGAGSSNPGIWPWVSVSLGIGWLATALVFWASNRYLRRRLNDLAVRPEPALAAPVTPVDLEQAAQRGDIGAFHAALLRWSRRQESSPPAGLHRQLSETQSRTLMHIEAYLFDRHSDTPVPDRDALLALSNALQALQTSDRAAPESDVMTLYP